MKTDNKHIHRAVEYGYKAWLRCANTQLFPPLVPVVQPDAVDSSCQKEGGDLWLHADQGHRTLLPPFLRTNPFKGEPLCDQTAGNAAELEASNTTALFLKL